MKTAIVCVSLHHGNTKKLAEAISERYGTDLIDASAQTVCDLSGYDVIGIASGIAYGKYYPQMLRFLERNLPEGKRVFFLHTAGDPRENQNAAAKAVTDAKQCRCLGTYCCKGFDTFGPFKLIGGIAKGHPNDADLAGAIDFYARCNG